MAKRGRKSKTHDIVKFLEPAAIFPNPLITYYASRKIVKERLCSNPYHRYLGVSAALTKFKVKVSFDIQTNKITLFRNEDQMTYML